jgi:hypothetical protein
MSDFTEADVEAQIAIRERRRLFQELMDMDAAGAFGKCCGDPCRACSVLETINEVIESGGDQ